jgi:hypothetical protein
LRVSTSDLWLRSRRSFRRVRPRRRRRAGMRRGRAHEGHREHLPAREHRAHERDCDVCARSGHRRQAAIDAAATKPFGFIAFPPGPGVGGHCLPIDPSYLSWRIKPSLGENFRFIWLANDINQHMPHYVVRRISAALNRDRKAVDGSRIVVLGVSYMSKETPAKLQPQRSSPAAGPRRRRDGDRPARPRRRRRRCKCPSGR